MVRFYRFNIETSDILDSDDEGLRTEFEGPAKSIGLFQTPSNSITAHILHARPLIIGTISSSPSGVFYPKSPHLHKESVTCTQKSHDPTTKYSIYECENLPGAIFNLEVAYPKIYYKQNQYVLAFDSEKMMTDEKIPGGIVLSKGTNGFYEIIGENGERINVEKFRKMYDKDVWPYAKLYFRNVRNHYFSYFREYENKFNLIPSGIGMKTRNHEGRLDRNLFRYRLWKKICDFFNFSEPS